MKKLLVHFLVVGAAIAITAYVVPGVHVESVSALAVAAVVLSLVNTFLRPVLAFFSFPLTLVTLGLFYLLVNGACFALAAYLVRGFEVNGVSGAVLGALATSFLSWTLEWLLTDDEESDEKRRKSRKG